MLVQLSNPIIRATDGKPDNKPINSENDDNVKEVARLVILYHTGKRITCLDLPFDSQ